MKYTIFAPDGAIVGRGDAGPQEVAQLALLHVGRVMDGEALDGDLWWVDPVSRLPHAKPPRPDAPHMTWDQQSRAWRDMRTEEQAWASVRAERKRRLDATDWRVARAAELGEPLPAPWRAYRQALRDITRQADPRSVAWPEPPAS